VRRRHAHISVMEEQERTSFDTIVSSLCWTGTVIENLVVDLLWTSSTTSQALRLHRWRSLPDLPCMQ